MQLGTPPTIFTANNSELSGSNEVYTQLWKGNEIKIRCGSNYEKEGLQKGFQNMIKLGTGSLQSDTLQSPEFDGNFPFD